MPKIEQLIITLQELIDYTDNSGTLQKILIQQNYPQESLSPINQLAKKNNIPVQYVPKEKMFSVYRNFNQGFIGIKSSIQYADLQEIIDQLNSENKVPLFIMLDGVTDIRNIGAIARTMYCTGAQALIIPDKGVAALNTMAIQASAGALELLTVCRVNSLLKAIDTLHANGIVIATTNLQTTQFVYQMDFKIPICILIGDEGRGVQPYLTKASDSIFKIPIVNDFDSYNVSVATGMILYEAMRQRGE